MWPLFFQPVSHIMRPQSNPVSFWTVGSVWPVIIFFTLKVVSMSKCNIAAWWTTAGGTLSDVVWLSSNGAADWSCKVSLVIGFEHPVSFTGSSQDKRGEWDGRGWCSALLCMRVAFEWHWIWGTVFLQLEDKVKEKMEDGLVDLYGINTGKNGGNSRLTNAWDDIQQTVGWTLSNRNLQCWRGRSEILSAGG